LFYISIFAYVSIIRYQQGKVKHIFEIFVTNYKRYLFNYYCGLAVFLADSSSIRVTTDIIRGYRNSIVNKLQDLLVGAPPDRRKPLPKQRFSTQSSLGLCYHPQRVSLLSVLTTLLLHYRALAEWKRHPHHRESFHTTHKLEPFSHLLRWFFIAPYERTFQSETS
jgi:hypothetical protein